MLQGFEGTEHYTLRCPGALSFVHGDDGEPRTLTTPDADRIDRAHTNYLARIASERERAERAAEAEPGKSRPYLGGPVGRPPRPFPPEVYFPGRPADAPEPGPGEFAPPPPAGVEGIPLTGRDDSMSDREQLKGLALIAAGQLGQANGVLDRAKTALDECAQLVIAAEHQMRSAQALVMRAVGTGAGAPPAGEQMAEYTMLAVSTIAGGSGSLASTLTIALRRLQDLQTQVSAAESNARQYAAIP